MKISPNITLKKSLTRKYWKDTRRVFINMRNQVLEQAKVSDPETLRLMIPALLEVTPMVNNLVNIWSEVGGRFAFDTHNKLTKKKSMVFKDDDFSDVGIGSGAAAHSLNDYKRRMRAYAYERSLLKANAIKTTEQAAINRVIDQVVEQSYRQGLSTVNTRNLMIEALSNELVSIERYQAERIARTEVNGAANTGSFEAAREDSPGAKKVWLTSNLPNTRDSHLFYQSMGAVDMNYEYSPGLQFPGDETGAAEEICNCRCTYYLETA